MVSIRRQRQIKLLFILSIILIIIIASILIFGYYPYGLHKKDMSDVKMPKDSIVYVSVKSLDSSILKFADSIYAYRISHDESMYDFSIMLKSVEAFANQLKTNNNFFVKSLSNPIIKRNASILLWGYNNNLNDSELFYMFDIGRINSFLFNSFFNPKELTIDDNSYIVKKIDYNGTKIYALDNAGPFIFFSFYNGILIAAKN